MIGARAATTRSTIRRLILSSIKREGDSFNNSPTPVYDYNQMMYRLDLATIPALTRLGGDYDDDGDVDGADFLVWQQTRGTFVQSGTGADGDGSGRVDTSDLAPWRLRYGMTNGVASSNASSLAVPEANLFAASAACVIGASLTRRRRIRRGDGS
jgi:hypothetical protein